MQAVSWIISVLVVALLLSWALYIVGVQLLPAGRRPKPRAYDRFGEMIGYAENPDFRVNPGEEAEPSPPVQSPPGRGLPPSEGPPA